MSVAKKIIKISIKTMMLFVILSLSLFGIILEPNIKIHGWQGLDETKLTKDRHAITILNSAEEDISEQIYGLNIYTPIDEISDTTINAFVSTEDKRFYSHSGIDYIRIAAAIKNNILSGSYKEGASTITQQLIKNTHLTNEKKNQEKAERNAHSD